MKKNLIFYMVIVGNLLVFQPLISMFGCCYRANAAVHPTAHNRAIELKHLKNERDKLHEDINYLNFSPDGRLSQAAFKELRETNDRIAALEREIRIQS